MKLTAEEIQSNWEQFINYIGLYITGDRQQKLLDFYNKHKDELIIMPASHKKMYHNSIVGGYIDHVLRVMEASLQINVVWNKFGVDNSTYTTEELIFSAMNHDLGKMGDGVEYAHILSTDKWRIDNLGENYKFNTKMDFMKVPDRSLFLLSQSGINISENEWIAIQTHDGLYDEGNNAYLKSYSNETKPRTALLFILHQADMLAARIEWERENLSQFNKEGKLDTKSKIKNPKDNKQQKAISSIKSEGLLNLLDKI